MGRWEGIDCEGSALHRGISALPKGALGTLSPSCLVGDTARKDLVKQEVDPHQTQACQFFELKTSSLQTVWNEFLLLLGYF